MSDTTQMFVGAGLVFGIPLCYLLVCFWLARRFGPRIAYMQRRRQVETALHRADYDRRIIQDVVDEWSYNPRCRYRR